MLAYGIQNTRPAVSLLAAVAEATFSRRDGNVRGLRDGGRWGLAEASVPNERASLLERQSSFVA